MKSMKEHFKEIYNPGEEIYSIKPPLPEKLQLELNETCNYHCVFCPFHSSYLMNQPKCGVMDIDFAKLILSKAAELGVGKKELALFATGEPLLYKKLPEMVAFAKELEYPYVYITTNGSMATLERIRPVIDAGIDSIRFSINALKNDYYEIHGVDLYDSVIDNLKQATKYIRENHYNVNISVSFVETKLTEGQGKQLKKELENYVTEIAVFKGKDMQYISSGLYKKYEIKSEVTKRRGGCCATLFNTMYIDSRKNVNLCCRNGKTKIPMGKLDEQLDFKGIWWGDKYTLYRQMMLEDKVGGTVCEDCFLRNIYI